MKVIISLGFLQSKFPDNRFLVIALGFPKEAGVGPQRDTLDANVDWDDKFPLPSEKDYDIHQFVTLGLGIPNLEQYGQYIKDYILQQRYYSESLQDKTYRFDRNVWDDPSAILESDGNFWK